MSQKQTKILIVNKGFDPDIGGIETIVKQYSELLITKGYEVTILCTNTQIFKATAVNYSHERKLKIIRSSSFAKINSMYISISFFYHLLKESRSASVIHAHYPFPLFDIGSIFLPKKSKILLSWHSDIVRQKFLQIFVKPFTSSLLKKSTVLYSSKRLLKSSYSNLLKKGSFKILPYSVPKTLSAPSNIKLKDFLGRDLPGNYFLYLGRLSYYKGINHILDSINQFNFLNKINFIIAGNGELQSEIKNSLIKLNKPNIFFIPNYLNEAEKSFLLSNCKALLFPSSFSSEAFGIIQLEAMSYAKPVINFNLPTSVPWVSKDMISGITVKNGDILKFSESIYLLENDSRLYNKLSNGAIKRVKKLFLEEDIFKKYLNIIEELILS